MESLPEFRFGWLNGWIPLVIYFIGLIISISLYSKESRAWLFNNPKDEGNRILVLIRLFGQSSMVAYIGMMIFTPLVTSRPTFLVGVIIYAIGFSFEMSTLHYFRLTPDHQPALEGPYRISRNPQWVGLFLVLFGSALTVGIWLYVGMVILVGVIYHKQILDEEKLCIQKYGEQYIAFMKQVPRYLLFF